MTTARDMMHFGATCVDASMTLADAATMMRDEQVGSLPICGEDNRLHGIITDRDIVVKCVAEGMDPDEVTAGELADGRLVWVESSADASEVSQMMRENRIRRLPVIADNELIGIISEADLANHLGDEELTEFVHEVYAAPPNN
ncbi:CBS domain protein [Stackebrandtia endophytica]|uniref:CBS domain protein n=1 Tax=Stackebrandtia endophytica TaxID=1496996 RepID=A0A543AY07_9ACTN|nr:CBS domain-containing protein [Stackebrandtia endophytica]TQL77465.1 CBS domain protein [Stackebrandtia endophytica]